MRSHPHLKKFLWLPVAWMLLVIVTGCYPKVYIDTYSHPAFDPKAISKVALVHDDPKGSDPLHRLFADIFLKTSLEKKRFSLVEERFLSKETLSRPGSASDADIWLEVALTHSYAGNRSRNFPTSVGATVKLIDPKTHQMLWNIDYAHASASGGRSAPAIEEVMREVSEKVIDRIPLQSQSPGYASYTLPGGKKSGESPILDTVSAGISSPPPGRLQPSVPATGNGDSSSPVAAKGHSLNPVTADALQTSPEPKGPYLVHIASVKRRELAEEFIDSKPADETVRLSTVVRSDSDKIWYRLYIGRFYTLEKTHRYIEKLKQSDRSATYAKPMKLPYSLLISSGRPLEPSEKIVEALRKIDYMAYLSSSVQTKDAYDVLVGAYGSMKEADERAQLLLTNGIPVRVVTP